MKSITNKLSVLLFSTLIMSIADAQNVGIGTPTPATKLTVLNTANGLGIEHTNGVVRIGTYIASPILAQIGTVSNHPFQLMANNGSYQFILMPSGLVGINVVSPNLAGLTVNKKVGAVNAIFGGDTTGIALESNYPGIGFNTYYNNGRKYMAGGFGGVIGLDPSNGSFTFASTLATGSGDATATTSDALTLTPAGATTIQGTDAGYIFKDRTATNYGGWNWYANNGSASLYRYTSNINTLTISPSGYLGIGTPIPASALDVNGSAHVSGATVIDGTFKLTSGTLNNGNYLAGNTNGFGSWAPTSNLIHITTATNNYGFTHTDGTATIATYVGTPTGGLEGGWIGTQNNFPLYFYTNGGAPRMTINTNGNIGMGTVPDYTTTVAVEAQNQNANTAIFARAENATGADGSNKGIICQALNGFNNYGVYGIAQSQTLGNDYGVYGYALGNPVSSNSIGVYGAGHSWAGYFDGNVYSTGTFQTSDEKLKTNIVLYHDAMNAIKNLPVRSYTFIQDGDHKKMGLPKEQQVGIMAGDIEKIFPQLVKTATSPIVDEQTKLPSGRTISFNAVNYTGLIPVLVEAVQEQQKELDDQQKELTQMATLKKEVEELKLQVAQLIKAH